MIEWLIGDGGSSPTGNDIFRVFSSTLKIVDEFCLPFRTGMLLIKLFNYFDSSITLKHIIIDYAT